MAAPSSRASLLSVLAAVSTAVFHPVFFAAVDRTGAGLATPAARAPAAVLAETPS